MLILLAPGTGLLPYIAFGHAASTLFRSSLPLIKSDTADVPGGLCNGVYVGTAGDVTILDEYGNLSLFKNKTADSVVPGRIKRVMSTGTTAADMNAMY